jgi:hypothetical protein
MYVHESLSEDSILNPNTPKKKALLIGGGVAAALAVAFVATRSSAKTTGGTSTATPGAAPGALVDSTCLQWSFLDDLSALGNTGRYRIEITLPPTKEAVFDGDKFVKAMTEIQAALPGLKIEGAWISMLAYPRSRSLPTDWPRNLDKYDDAMRLRVQYISAYQTFGDLVSQILSMEYGSPLPVLRAWQCTSTPAVAPMKLPVKAITVEDSDGGVTFMPFRHYVLLMTPSRGQSIQNMAALLANQGFLIAATQTGENLWGFDVYYRNTTPLKWAKGSVPGLFVQEVALDLGGDF